MSGILFSAVTGNYRPIGEIGEATYVVAHAFGYQTGENGERVPGPVNEDLARRLYALPLGGNWVVQREIWDAVPTAVKIGRRALNAKTLVVCQSMPDDILDRPVEEWEEGVEWASMPEDEYLSSQHIWEFATQQAEKWGVTEPRPLVIAHAHHVGRVAAQGRILGLDPIVPRGLDRNLNGLFDSGSAQSWTRSRTRWAIRELLAIPALVWLPRLNTLRRIFQGRNKKDSAAAN